jgi:hypothetical protein
MRSAQTNIVRIIHVAVFLSALMGATSCSNSAKQEAGPGAAPVGAACTPPASYELSVNLFPQKASNWCWAASSEMAMQSLGKEVEQCQQANNAFSADCCCAPGTANCGKSRSISCNKPWWPELEKYQFSERHTCRQAISWDELKSQIACKKTPVLFSWLFGRTDNRPTNDVDCVLGGKGHMMVVKGYSEANGEQIVVVNDPLQRVKRVTYGDYSGTSDDHHHWNDYYDINQSGGIH